MAALILHPEQAKACQQAMAYLNNVNAEARVYLNDAEGASLIFVATKDGEIFIQRMGPALVIGEELYESQTDFQTAYGLD